MTIKCGRIALELLNKLWDNVGKVMAFLRASFLLSLPGNKVKYFEKLYELAYTINEIDCVSMFLYDCFFVSVRLL